MTNTHIDITFLGKKKKAHNTDSRIAREGHLSPYKQPNKRLAHLCTTTFMMRNSPLLKRGHFILSAVINIESSLLLENTLFTATSTITTS